MMEKIERENEIIINGSRVFIENGEVKEILNEEIQRKGYISVEESRELTLAAMKLQYKIMQAKQRKQYPILTPEGKEKWQEATRARDEMAERMRLQALTNSILAAEGREITLSFKEYSPVGKQKFFVDLSFESVYRADADKVIFYGDMVVSLHALGKGFIVYSLTDKSFHKGHLTSGTNVEPDMRLVPDNYREENLGLIERLVQHILEFLSLEAGYEVNTNK